MKHHKLIIDVGMHAGEDTEFYLAKGFDVVAIEANPSLVDAAKTKFAREIAHGQLRIMQVAISHRSGTERLAVANDTTIWSSLSPGFVARNEALMGTSYRYIDVPSRRFDEVLDEVGIPHYLKIDIEGLDMLCVKALHSFSERPAFVSIESSVSGIRASADAVFDELAELWVLGYRHFKYVDQSKHPQRRCPLPAREGRYVDWQFTTDSSGLFGTEAPGQWRSASLAFAIAQAHRLHHNVGRFGGAWTDPLPARLYRAFRRRVLDHPVGWFDLHAALPHEESARASSSLAPGAVLETTSED